MKYREQDGTNWYYWRKRTLAVAFLTVSTIGQSPYIITLPPWGTIGMIAAVLRLRFSAPSPWLYEKLPSTFSASNVNRNIMAVCTRSIQCSVWIHRHSSPRGYQVNPRRDIRLLAFMPAVVTSDAFQLDFQAMSLTSIRRRQLATYSLDRYHNRYLSSPDDRISLKTFFMTSDDSILRVQQHL